MFMDVLVEHESSFDQAGLKETNLDGWVDTGGLAPYEKVFMRTSLPPL